MDVTATMQQDSGKHAPSSGIGQRDFRGSRRRRSPTPTPQPADETPRRATRRTASPNPMIEPRPVRSGQRGRLAADRGVCGLASSAPPYQSITIQITKTKLPSLLQPKHTKKTKKYPHPLTPPPPPPHRLTHPTNQTPNKQEKKQQQNLTNLIPKTQHPLKPQKKNSQHIKNNNSKKV